MKIQTSNDIVIDVGFDPRDRENGFDDEIYIALSEMGSQQARILRADEVRFLLTRDEANRFALALQMAVREAERTPRR